MRSLSTASRRSSARAPRRAAQARVGTDDRAPLAYESADEIRLAALKSSDDAEIAASRQRSTARRRTTACTPRCGSTAASNGRGTDAARRGRRRAVAVRAGRTRRRAEAGAPLARGVSPRARASDAEAVPRGVDEAELAELWEEMTSVRAPPHGRAVVTVDDVWAALAEIPDPETPSSRWSTSAWQGHRRRERNRARGLHADLHGVPGARGDATRDGDDDRRARSRARRPSSTGRLVVDRRHHGRGPREAAHRGIRSSCAARPGKLELVQLQRGFRCPYCGSTSTKLENLFGPTPCRSIRYCDDCRQPFEQFKTI